MGTLRPGSFFLLLIPFILLGVNACNQTQPAQVAQDPSQALAQTGDPANGNLAPAGQYPQSPPQQSYAQPSGAPQQSYDQQASPPQQPYTQPASPPPPQESSAQPAPVYNNQNYNNQNYPADNGYDTASNQPPLYADQPPPPIPEYSQPPCPGNDYLWTPGYWNYSSGYYWVPGAWVIAPYIGALWTPPYWGFQSGRYFRHAGYWGPTIGFYGGINYGFGYTGRGLLRRLLESRSRGTYNRNVTNVNTNVVRNVYNYQAPVVNATRCVSYNGGRGGVNVRPTSAELAVLREPRVPPVPAQVEHVQQAAANRAQFAAVNRGRPQTLAAAVPLPTNYRAPATHLPANTIRLGGAAGASS